MVKVECPWCGPCDESEFTYGAESRIPRPAYRDACSEEAWGDHGFAYTNSRGLQTEQWRHSGGCRRSFNVARDIQTYRVYAVYRMGEPMPGFDS